MLQLDEPLYERLRSEAFERGISLSALVRETLSKVFGFRKRKKKLLIDKFKFIGCGRSGLRDVAERHDDYFAEAILEHIKERRR